MIPVEYVSFDGSTRIATRAAAPDRYRFWDSCGVASCGISRGAGLSYAAASFSASASTVEHRHFNRLLDFDSGSGILEVEAGVTLGQVYEFAAPRNLFLSIQPGHPSITVGGCIGPDVHGKNQFRDGTFLSAVHSLRLFHPDHGVLELSRDAHPDLFYLTAGGFGLTGNILSARIRLTPLRSRRVKMSVAEIGNVFDLPAILHAGSATSDLIYSWHDFTASGDKFGAGFLVSGSFDTNTGPAGDQPRRRTTPLTAESRGRLRFTFFNTYTVRAFNLLYHASVRLQSHQRQVSLYEFLFPVHNKELYFRLFGARGFHECQFVIPTESFAPFMADLRSALRRRPVPVTLASAKLFRGERDLLRFTGDGICLALDFPRTPEGLALAAYLDDLLRTHGGWPNLIKDSRLTAAVAAATYPQYPLFRRKLRDFDPRRLYRSELSERLEL